jgi:hypothetical protein
VAAPEEDRPEISSTDPDTLARALELELMQKRAVWERARQRRGTWRALSFLFLLLVIAGALLVWFYLLPVLNRGGADRGAPPAAGESR